MTTASVAVAYSSRTSRTRAWWRVPAWITASVWLVSLLLGALVVKAERYLASFGPPGMSGPSLASLLYDVQVLIAPLAIILLLLASIVALFVCVVSIVLNVLHQRPRRGPRPLSSLAVALGFLGAIILIIAVEDAGISRAPGSTMSDIRRAGLADAAQRLMPLVEAIERYERAEGRPPVSLYQLVPRYIPSLAGYGVRGCRRLKYYGPPRFASWELTMECPGGWLRLDNFVYEPGRSYASAKRIERFGGWAYIPD